MKNLFTMLSFLFVFALGNVQAVVGVQSNDNLNEVYGVNFDKEITMDAFLDMNLKEIQKETGTKLRLKDKIALKVAQRQLKKMKKKGATKQELKDASGDKNFDIIGFLLGFLLGLIGVLIVWLVWKDKAKTRSAWLGLLVALALIVIGVLI